MGPGVVGINLQRPAVAGHRLIHLARGLATLTVELISTGGTRKALAEAGLAVRDIAEVTGVPEMLDGRVKTLHPRVHGGILAVRDNPAHAAALRQHGIEPIDLVVCNLYPFEATVARPGVKRMPAGARPVRPSPLTATGSTS